MILFPHIGIKIRDKRVDLILPKQATGWAPLYPNKYALSAIFHKHEHFHSLTQVIILIGLIRVLMTQ